MMAGCVYVVAGPTGFWSGFLISEIIAITARLSSIGKEDLLMGKIISLLEASLPYGLSPLKSL